MSQSRVFDRVADVYDATRGGEERGSRTAKDIGPWLVPGMVLEVAVGTGVIAAALRAEGYGVIGVDLSAGMLAHAGRRLGPGRVARADALTLPLTESTVDNVVFVNALHVIGDVPAALAEAGRVLRPGGRLVALHAPWRREPSDLQDALSALTALKDAQAPDTPAAVDAAADAAGLRLVTRTTSTPARFESSPADEADKIEQRLWSFLWDIDEATWREVVEPSVAQLRALPDPDRPRTDVSHCQVSVFTRSPRAGMRG
jgi:SAM-dependent methyltransferase